MMEPFAERSRIATWYFLADATKPVKEEDEHAISALGEGMKALLILTKIDRVDDKRLLLPLIQRYTELFPFADAVPVSARKGDGLNRLGKYFAVSARRAAYFQRIT